ncbi:MAG TPA: histidine kinase [Desulfurivibrio alkaliphilus]|uniref:Histidine kinase n=1 Tax=Desulfurivibrio alkaliphilus TaxID=427923 RepID=A0A7C2XUP8_9BACT|nr:histidine kinase [Desulfurivibrio alkaliphilus]
MRILLESQGRADALAGVLQKLEEDPAVAGIMLLGCSANDNAPSELRTALAATDKPLFGGVFPQIMHGRQRLSRGTVAVGLPIAPRVAVIEELSRPQRDLDAALVAAFPEPAAGGTLFVFVDAMSSGAGALVEALYNHFGLENNYLGGGCGTLSFTPLPCVLDRSGMHRDSVVLAMVDLPSSIGVAHGWRPISEPLKVTGAGGNAIHSLDWRPAWPVYRELVRLHAKHDFSAENFFQTAKSYPFGITRLGGEIVVRDPVRVVGESLLCVGETPSRAFVRILHGDRSTLLAAASKARQSSDYAYEGGGRYPTIRLAMDCISRALFLEADFWQEMAAIDDGLLPFVGALTIGEIANYGQDYLEFYNKTAVVGVL